MKIIHSIFILGILFSSSVQSQIKFPMQMDSLPNHIIKGSVLSLFDPNGSNFEIGYERKFSKNQTLQLSAAYIFGTPIFIDSGEDYDASGFKLKVEGKQYIQYEYELKQYFAAEVAFHYQKEKNRRFYFRACDYCTGNTITYYTDTIDLYRNYTTLNFKYGLQKRFGDLALESYIGLGVKYRYVNHRKRERPEDTIDEDGYFIPRRRNDEGSTFVVSLPFNVKVGYWF